MIVSRLAAFLSLLFLFPFLSVAEISVVHDLDNIQTAQDVRSHIQDNAQARSYDEYKLNAGDAIEIRVFGEESLNLDVVLDNSGVINYPFLGRIFVNGLSVAALTEVLTKGLADGYLVDPHVNVSIVKYRPFFITGQVNNPGSYPFEPRLNVKKAVSLAGGFAETADKQNITIVYEGRGKQKVKAALASDIHPGDTISVGDIGYFFIDGEVKNPGKYPYQPGLTVRKAISIAGGYTERAAKDRIVIMSNDDSMERKAGLKDAIRSGDSITVDESLF